MGENKNIFAKFKEGLARTKSSLALNLEAIFKMSQKIDEEFFMDLEDTLIMADVGVDTSAKLIGKLKRAAKEQNIGDREALRRLLIQEIKNIFGQTGAKPFDFNAQKKVYLIVGVNGVGKTTTIAKLAARFTENRRQILLVAGDTFRAAATEQLMLWGERLGVSVIHHQEGGDPAAVVYDGMAAGKARKVDVIIIDTAGRLHTKVNLMEELKKVQRVVTQNIEDRMLETILVLDATTGQNAINQTKIFNEALKIDGLILTKLDGTAKGGIVVAIADQFKIPIYLVGLGEKKEDLQEFEPDAFINALFE